MLIAMLIAVTEGTVMSADAVYLLEALYRRIVVFGPGGNQYLKDCD